MPRTVSRGVYWIPRIFAIVLILFLPVFSLDVVQPGISRSQIALGLIIHNIPSLVLLVVLILSWRREIIGGIAFLLAGVAFIVFTFTRNPDSFFALLISSLVLGIPLLLTGVMFLACWVQKKRAS